MLRTMKNVRLQRRQRNNAAIILHEGIYPLNAVVDIKPRFTQDDKGKTVQASQIIISLPPQSARPELDERKPRHFIRRDPSK